MFQTARKTTTPTNFSVVMMWQHIELKKLSRKVVVNSSQSFHITKILYCGTNTHMRSNWVSSPIMHCMYACIMYVCITVLHYFIHTFKYYCSLTVTNLSSCRKTTTTTAIFRATMMWHVEGKHFKQESCSKVHTSYGHSQFI